MIRTALLGAIAGGGSTPLFGGSMLRRSNSFTAYSNGSGNNSGHYFKFECPYPAYTWVRVWISLKNQQNNPYTAPAFKVAVAATETFLDAADAFGNSADTVRYTPIVGNVSYNTAGTPGWTRATGYNGGQSTPPTAVPEITAGQQSGHVDALIVHTDKISINSVPRADGGSGSLVMVRVHVPTGGTFTNVSNASGTNGIVAQNTAYPNERIQYAIKFSADPVTNLGSIATGTANPSSGSDSYLNVWVEFGTQANASSPGNGTLCSFGDSIWGRSIATDNQSSPDSWTMKAAYVALPLVGAVNNSCGGTSTGEMRSELDQIFAADTQRSIKYVMLPNYSPNNLQDAGGLATAQTNINYMIAQCRARGIKMYLWTLYALNPNSAWTTTAATWARGLAASDLFIIDVNALYPSGTSHLIDLVHPTAATAAAMATLAASVISANH